MLSVVTPAFNEASNLEAMRARLTAALHAAVGDDWEWVVVDDHSADDTFAAIDRLSRDDPRIRGLRLSRNSGSHTAITCGLHHAQGDAAVMLAGDLQDPPELLASLLERWRGGAQVVWAMRREQPGEAAHAGFAALYYWVMRNVAGLTTMPARGADVFLVDRVVIEAMRQFPERAVSVFALITWLGFRQAFVEYDKQPRASGRSGWTRAKKIRLVVDSVTAFTDAPIRACTLLGTGLFAVGLVVVMAGLARWFTSGHGHFVILAGTMAGLVGIQLVGMGVVGEYVWRALEESRRRPPYVIEGVTASTGLRSATGAGASAAPPPSR